ncbi:hypothetical protein DVA81_19590, partial [Acinetobacter baumannii]
SGEDGNKGNQLKHRAKIIHFISFKEGLNISPTSVFFALIPWNSLWPLFPNIIKLLGKHKKKLIYNSHQ